MDSKSTTNRLAASLGRSNQSVSDMLKALAKILTDSAESMTTVAIPSFGSFVPVKHDEEIKTDHATGKKTLFPPKIEIEFNPAVSLRKKIVENNGK